MERERERDIAPQLSVFFSAVLWDFPPVYSNIYIAGIVWQFNQM